jgi:SARP family transcriptional regulator, regulator of embCAB operon
LKAEKTMRISLLGPLELHGDGGTFALRGPKVQQILALLVLRANKIVQMDTLVDELWSQDPPRTAVSSVRTHVYHLRCTLRAKCGEPLISTRPSGYTLTADPARIDVEVFSGLVKQAKSLLHDDRLEHASRCLSRALGIWKGQPMANVETGPVLTGYAVQLREQRLNALQLRIEAELALGRHRDMVGELKALVSADPFNEWFYARLIDALNQSGRRREALDTFHALRTHLNDELGVEPSGEVQREHQAVLCESPRGTTAS